MSRGVVVAAVAVIAVIALVVGWFKIRDTAAEQEDAAAASCVEGAATLVVAADPDVVEPLRVLAQQFAETGPVVRDHCMTVAVNPVASAQAFQALTGNAWDEARFGPRPAMWVPQSGDWAARLPRESYEGEPHPIAWSPIVVAAPSPLADTLRTAGIGWRDLPGLQSDPGSLAALSLPDWGSLRMALPLPGPSLLATAAVAAQTADAPLADAIGSPAVASAAARLAAGQPTDEPAEQIMARLAGPVDPAAPIHALPATEQQAAAAGLAAVAPTGDTPVADYPAVELAGDWVDETQHRTADLFVDYIRSDGAAVLTDAGFRAAPVEPALAPLPVAVADRLAELLATRATATTVLIDTSSSMGTDGRLDTVVAALRAAVTSAPETAALGLWTYSKNLAGTTPYRDEVRTEPLRPERRQILEGVLNGVRPTTSERDQAYPTIIAAYTAAVTGFVPGLTNSVLLVTDGPNDDSPVTGRALLDAVATAGDPAKPVRIDVIALGEGPSTDTLQQLTDRTGGRLVRVPPDGFGTALTEVLAQ